MFNRKLVFRDFARNLRTDESGNATASIAFTVFASLIALVLVSLVSSMSIAMNTNTVSNSLNSAINQRYDLYVAERLQGGTPSFTSRCYDALDACAIVEETSVDGAVTNLTLTAVDGERRNTKTSNRTYEQISGTHIKSIRPDGSYEWETKTEIRRAIPAANNVVGDEFGGCTIAGDKTLCWGLYTGDSSEGSFRPVLTLVDAKLSGLVAAAGTRCGIDEERHAWCWGEARNGAAGVSGMAGVAWEPQRVAGDRKFVQLFAARDSGTDTARVCGLDMDSKAWCWGGNSHGSLGAGAPTGYADEPVAVEGNRPYVTMSVGPTHTCAVDTAAQAWCWGSNASYQLGDTTRTSSSIPVKAFEADDMKNIFALHESTCGQMSNSKLLCWGVNTIRSGNSSGFSEKPFVIANQSQTQWSTVVASGQSMCMIHAVDGLTYCSGLNNRGQLGAGTTGGVGTPAVTAGNHMFVELVAGNESFCGITGGGQTYCWGAGTQGQTGTGAAADRNVPTLVVGAPTGAHHLVPAVNGFYVFDSFGGLHAWGQNTEAALGVGHGTNALTATQLSFPDVESVAPLYRGYR